MKQIWPNYSYSPTTNVLTLTGLNIDRDQLLLVTAADRGRIMYNFADSTVTASAFTAGANTGLTLVASTAGLTTTAALVIYYDDQLASTTVTVSSLPAISGTVTVGALPPLENNTDFVNVGAQIAEGINTELGVYVRVEPSNPLPISGTVTVGNTVTIAGTVTANPTGTQTIAGSVTIGAGTAQIGSVTASISGTVPVSGTFFQTTQPVSLATLPALAAGTAQIGSVTASISNSVTIASLPAISGTVTANISISSTAITSGSFTSLTSATLVPANTARKMATVFNQGAGQLFVNAGATATTLGGGFMVALSSGDFYECDYTTTTLSAIFATAGTASWVSH